MNEWISVEDRMPDKGSFVLVYGYLGSAPQICTARYESHDKKFETDHFCEANYVDEVTHWMPLPELPK
jgi:hypothetical protein